MDFAKCFVYLKTASGTTSAKRRTARDQIVELGDPGLFLRTRICPHLRGLTDQDLFRIGPKLCHGFLDELIEGHRPFFFAAIQKLSPHPWRRNLDDAHAGSAQAVALR